jgi:hypothetical protein
MFKKFFNKKDLIITTLVLYIFYHNPPKDKGYLNIISKDKDGFK